ncbi:asparagine synthetase B [Capsulimonas corticalis]|uniref:asparagine synthase (glutamine-hydrolyzing) n=2 Tax=Capsulimonas corticalis TaxID=2219043 RepID=A0A402CTR4_9BACT|nr:asparagine synthetase B [Capsulimonas corticalis]
MEALAHRGSSPVNCWVDGSAAFGSSLLRTTRESHFEQAPLRDAANDRVMTADARLDNRDELIARLQIPQRSPDPITDGQIILASYEKWGPQCPEKLLGDFAFAIWDRSDKTLFCARDHFGVRPFYYYKHHDLFLFASEIKGLLAMPEAQRLVNEDRVLEYLAGYAEDLQHTFYQRIFKLPPAHSMMVRDGEISMQPYWSVEAAQDIRLSSDAEYAEAFRSIFLQAVHSRSRANTPLGSTLSGGLDSSSIACAASQYLQKDGREPLQTFSVVFDDVPKSDERDYMRAALDMGGMEPHKVHGDRIGPFSNIDQMLSAQDQPFTGPNLFLHWAMYAAAKTAGVGVLLDGLDGDTTVSHGVSRLTELARAMRWPTLLREAKGVARNLNGSTRTLIATQAVYPFVPKAMLGVWKAARRRQPPASVLSACLNADFQTRTRFHERSNVLLGVGRRPCLTEKESHHYRMSRGIVPHVLEITDHASAAFSLEVRYPFFDRRLVEFCLGVPPDQKLRDGWTRWIMRKAMTGVLPEQIQWRGGKSDLGHNFLHTFAAFDIQRIEAMLASDGNSLSQYVNMSSIRSSLDRFAIQPSWEDAELPLKASLLALWLQKMT